jgi:HSP20 family protein
MFEEIDTTIESVERLYRTVSGRDVSGAEPTFAQIPPERDASKHVEDQVDRLLTTLGAVALPGAPRATPQPWAPLAAVWERPDEVRITVDVPGVPRELLEVATTPTVICITGRRPPALDSSEGRLVSAEAPLGAFRRLVPLPPGCALDKLTASLKDGVLEIRLPRVLGPSNARTIAIQ